MVGWQVFVCGALASLLATLCITPLMIRAALRLGFIDSPAHRKIHSIPVPYLGGMAILLGLGAAFLVLWLAWPETFAVLIGDGRLEIVLAAVLAVSMMGLIDDKYEIRARYKFVWQLLVVSAFAFFGYHFRFLSLPGLQNPVDLKFLGIPLTALWMLAVINGINLIDGIDGLAGSVACAISISIWGVAWALHDPVMSTLAICATGAIVGFLVFNWKPARIYMGETGSSALGMLIAAALVALGQHQPADTGGFENMTEPDKFYLLYAWLLVVYPLLEVSLSALRRHLAGKSIASADRGHIHHRLVQRNWAVPQICVVAALISLLTGFAILMTVLGYRSLSAIFLMAMGILVGVVLHTCGYATSLATSQNVRPHFLIANYFVSMQKMKLELAQSLNEVSTLINQAAIEFGVKSYTVSIASFSGEGKIEWTWPQPIQGPSAPEPAGASANSPQDAARSDQVELPECKAKATWIFEASGAEQDIDVEYRVLMAEFMRKALFTALPFCGQANPSASAVQSCDPVLISSSALKRRISVRKLGHSEDEAAGVRQSQKVEKDE